MKNLEKESFEIIQEFQKDAVECIKKGLTERSYNDLINMVKECPLFDLEEDGFFYYTKKEQKQYKEELIKLIELMLDLVLLKQDLNYKHLTK